MTTIARLVVNDSSLTGSSMTRSALHVTPPLSRL
jgi:hypothetical protein